MRMSESRIVPSFDLEAAEMALEGGPIVGIDEAGRGPWAGPVVAAAVILDPQRIPQGIDDSKMLDAEERERLYLRITATALAVGVGIGDVDRIDRDNILAATLWAMSDAMSKLDAQAETGHHRRQSGAAPRLHDADHRQRRRQVPFHRGRVHRRQGHARPDDDQARGRVAGLWFRTPQGLRDARAQIGAEEARRHAVSQALVQARPARFGARGAVGDGAVRRSELSATSFRSRAGIAGAGDAGRRSLRMKLRRRCSARDLANQPRSKLSGRCDFSFVSLPLRRGSRRGGGRRCRTGRPAGRPAMRRRPELRRRASKPWPASAAAMARCPSSNGPDASISGPRPAASSHARQCCLVSSCSSMIAVEILRAM